MAELDIVELQNPTKEDFVQKYNGEPYTLKAGERRTFSKHVGLHIAKHLAMKMVDSELLSKAPKKDLDNPNSRVNIVLAQSQTHDTPLLRMQLYKILGDKTLVEYTIGSYPFKGIIGDIREYDDFVTKQEKVESKS